MPLTDIDIEFVFNGKPGTALVWVIDQECLYDLPLSMEHAQAFLDADEVVDISADYLDHDGVTVRLLKAGETLLELSTTEYFGSILLSDPQVVKLADYPYGRYVESPNARFDGEKFEITNRDVSGLWPWLKGENNVSVAEV
jgi:hypothetical protein